MRDLVKVAKARGCSRSLVLVSLLLGLTTAAGAQSLQVTTANNAAVNEGDTLWIDQNPLMPPLTLAVSGGELSCDTLTYIITLNWTATTGQQSNGQVTGQFACNQSQMVDWRSVGYAGGNTTIQYTGADSCGNALFSGTFSLIIAGKNPPNSGVANLISSPLGFGSTSLLGNRTHTPQSSIINSTPVEIPLIAIVRTGLA